MQTSWLLTRLIREGNQYIETGYRYVGNRPFPFSPTNSSLWRRVTASVRECFRSWTYLHNETGRCFLHSLEQNTDINLAVNIFSHLFGAFLFFGLPLYIFNTEIPPRYTVATLADKVVCSTYFLGVGACFS